MEETKKCPYCGEILPPLSKVCPSCGQIVDDSEGDDVTTMMSEIDTVCEKFANSLENTIFAPRNTKRDHRGAW